MSRPVLILSACAAIVGDTAVGAIVVALNQSAASPQFSQEQHAIREKFFGTNKPLPPIEKGQEMRPRW